MDDKPIGKERTKLSAHSMSHDGPKLRNTSDNGQWRPFAFTVFLHILVGGTWNWLKAWLGIG